MSRLIAIMVVAAVGAPLWQGLRAQEHIGDTSAARIVETVVFNHDGVIHSARLHRASGDPSSGFISVGAEPDQWTSGLMPVWDVQAGDLDGDGNDELVVGTWSRRGPQRDATQRTIWVLEPRGNRLVSIWRGSRLPHPFERFTLERRGKRDVLVTYAVGPGLEPTTYDWTGFGFSARAPAKPLHVVFIGDTAIARGVPRRQLRPPDEALAAVAAADIAIANLETTIGPPQPDSPRPRLTVSADELGRLASWGIDAVTRSNNHAFDAGPDGWRETSKALTALDVRDVSNHQMLPGIQVLSASTHPPRPGATFSILGRARANAAFIDEVGRAAKSSQIIIVSLHGGNEGKVGPSVEQRRLTRRLVDSGADVVVWHGSHRAAPVERIGSAVVAWNLGDFALGRTVDGCALHLLLSPGGTVTMTTGPWSCENAPHIERHDTDTPVESP